VAPALDAHTIDIGSAVAHVDLQIAAFYPAQLRQLVQEDGAIGGELLSFVHLLRNRETPHARVLLGASKAWHRPA
jgi:hypothetical protein